MGMAFGSGGKFATETVIETTWTTVSTTNPAPCGKIGCAVMHYSTDNQIGTVYKILRAVVVWKGKEHRMVLEQIEIETEKRLERKIISNGFGGNINLFLD